MSGGRQAGIRQVMVRSKKNKEGDGWKGMGLFYMGGCARRTLHWREGRNKPLAVRMKRISGKRKACEKISGCWAEKFECERVENPEPRE